MLSNRCSLYIHDTVDQGMSNVPTVSEMEWPIYLAFIIISHLNSDIVMKSLTGISHWVPRYQSATNISLDISMMAPPITWYPVSVCTYWCESGLRVLAPSSSPISLKKKLFACWQVSCVEPILKGMLAKRFVSKLSILKCLESWVWHISLLVFI